MSAIPVAKPESIGIDPAASRRADELVQRWIADDRIPAAGWCARAPRAHRRAAPRRQAAGGEGMRRPCARTPSS